MRQFYELVPFLENMQQAVAQIGQKVISTENELVQQAAAQNGSEMTPQLAAQIGECRGGDFSQNRNDATACGANRLDFLGPYLPYHELN